MAIYSGFSDLIWGFSIVYVSLPEGNIDTDLSCFQLSFQWASVDINIHGEVADKTL